MSHSESIILSTLLPGLKPFCSQFPFACRVNHQVLKLALKFGKKNLQSCLLLTLCFSQNKSATIPKLHPEVSQLCVLAQNITSSRNPKTLISFYQNSSQTFMIHIKCHFFHNRHPRSFQNPPFSFSCVITCNVLPVFSLAMLSFLTCLLNSKLLESKDSSIYFYLSCSIY